MLFFLPTVELSFTSTENIQYRNKCFMQSDQRNIFFTICYLKRLAWNVKNNGIYIPYNPVSITQAIHFYA